MANIQAEKRSLFEQDDAEFWFLVLCSRVPFASGCSVLVRDGPYSLQVWVGWGFRGESRGKT